MHDLSTLSKRHILVSIEALRAAYIRCAAACFCNSATWCTIGVDDDINAWHFVEKNQWHNMLQVDYRISKAITQRFNCWFAPAIESFCFPAHSFPYTSFLAPPPPQESKWIWPFYFDRSATASGFLEGISPTFQHMLVHSVWCVFSWILPYEFNVYQSWYPVTSSP